MTNSSKSCCWSCEVEETESYFLLGSKTINQGNDDPDINTLDNVTLHNLVVEMNAKEEDKERDSLDLKLKDFDAKDFDDWSKSFIVYLDSIAGGAGTPLSYVVRSEDADPDDATNVHDRQIWLARLDGPIFENDNLVVHCALHNLLISTSGFTWFEQALDGDGRAAFKALTDHYKGHELHQRQQSCTRIQVKQQNHQGENQGSIP